MMFAGVGLVLFILIWSFRSFLHRMDNRRMLEELTERLDDEPLGPGESREVETDHYILVPYWVHQVARSLRLEVGHVRSVAVTYNPDADYEVGDDDEDEDEDAHF